jgi:hypothetical protein
MCLTLILATELVILEESPGEVTAVKAEEFSEGVGQLADTCKKKEKCELCQ